MPTYSSPQKVVPPKISLYHYLSQSHSLFSPNAPALIDALTNQTVTRAAVVSQCLSLASGLRNLPAVGGLELRRGSTVALFSTNCTIYPVTMFALAAAGFRAAYINSSYVDHELAHALRISASSHVIVQYALLPIAVRALASLGYSIDESKKRIVLLSHKDTVPGSILSEGWITIDDLLPGDTVIPEPFDGADAQETAIIYFSSGTTGPSKAVELSHYNVVASLEQYRSAWKYYKHGRDVLLAVVPFFHVFGGIGVVMYAYVSGLPLVILPRFDPARFLSSIPRHKVTAAFLVPPLVRFLAKEPLVDNYDLSTLRIGVVGAAPVSPALINELESRFAARGITLIISEGLGMTETCGAVSFQPLETARAKRGTVGVLTPNFEARLVGENGEDVPEGEAGELWLRAPNVMKGYVGNAQATADAITPDGWLKTGDIATFDIDGHMKIVDRRKELIKYKGFQVSPVELEGILAAHPKIADVGVVGVYSDEGVTELPRAYVVLHDAANIAQEQYAKIFEDVHDWVNKRVAPYKRLRGGIFPVKEIPRSTAGKILRRNLRAKL
ncbi:AMP binding protein [Amylocystis lapponica]|nr:AMP binding protein [Amylocystis lapponica]